MAEQTKENTYQILTQKGFLPEQPLTARKSLSASEKGVHYHIETAEAKSSCCYEVDGYIIKEGNKCDKLILINLEDNDWAEIFVELKGSDINHAIKQLRATVQNQLFQHPTNKKRKARIVAHSFPSNKSMPAFEKARKEFFTKYGCELRRLKNKQPDTL